MNTALRIVNSLILAGILLVLTQIRSHMPPTLGELMKLNKATQAEKNQLLLRQPMALPVEINNTPIEVEISQ